MWKPLRWLIVVSLVAAVAGCGGSFDPAEHRPCDFLDKKELKEYQLRRASDKDDTCVFGKPPLAQDSLDELTIVYLDETPEALARRAGLQPVTVVPADDTRITFQGSRMDTVGGTTDPYRGHCLLAVPLGDSRTMLMDFTIDTTSVHWVSVAPVREPCAYIAQDKFGLALLLEKLE